MVQRALVDAGPLTALYNANDYHHREIFSLIQEDFLTIAELFEKYQDVPADACRFNLSCHFQKTQHF